MLSMIARLVSIVAFCLMFVLAVLLKKYDSLPELVGWAGLGTGAFIASIS